MRLMILIQRTKRLRMAIREASRNKVDLQRLPRFTDCRLSFPRHIWRGASSTARLTRKVNELRDTVLNLGFVKLVWDVLRYFWKRFYRERISVDLDIAYHPAGAELEKRVFLKITNGTNNAVKADMFIWESDFWHRYIHSRKMHKIVLTEPIVTVPAKSAMRQAFAYVPGNLFYSDTNYFGLRLTTGMIRWVPTRHWRRAFREFRKDFPNWREHPRPAIPLKFKEYGDPK